MQNPATPLSEQDLTDLLLAACVAPDAKRPKNLDLKAEWFAFVDIDSFPRHADRRIVADRAVTACKPLPLQARGPIIQPFIAYVDRDIITSGFLYGEGETLFGSSSPHTGPSDSENKAPQSPSTSPSFGSSEQRIRSREHLNVQWTAGDVLQPRLAFSTATISTLKQREQQRQVTKGTLLMEHFLDMEAVHTDADIIERLSKEYTAIRKRLRALDQVVADCEGLLAAESTIALVEDGAVGLTRIRAEVDAWFAERVAVKHELEPLLVRLQSELQSSYGDYESAKTVFALRKFVQKSR